jgi:hypothetical protein
METILQEIERALQSQMYYLALQATLTLPDICAALEAPNGRTSGDKYRAWFNANAAARLSFLTADDCYSLRCGVVHQGKFGPSLKQYDRPIFVLPANAVFVNCKITMPDKEYFLSGAAEFCREIIAAVREWFGTKALDATVQANLPNLIQYHPSGFGPVHGSAVIA